MSEPIVINLPCKECFSPKGIHLPGCSHYELLTCQQPPETRANTIVELVHLLSVKDGNHSLTATVRKATGHELFTWWHEAQAFSLLASAGWERKLCDAVSATIAVECVRRRPDVR